MIRVGVTILLVLAWHFPTTFFVPGSGSQIGGRFVWPFTTDAKPVLDMLTGLIAPDRPPATPAPTLALLLAGLATVGFLVAIAGLWAIVVPTEWFGAATIVGAAASLLLFVIYLGPWSIAPFLVDAVVLWGVVGEGWTAAGLAGS